MIGTRNSKKALSAGLANLFMKMLLHNPRDLDSKLAHQWDNLPAEVLEQALAEFLNNPPLGILEYAGIVQVPIAIEKFVARERLLSETGCGTNISIYDYNEYFRKCFANYEASVFVSLLRFDTLVENAVDGLISRALGGIPKALTTIIEVEALMAMQSNGESTQPGGDPAALLIDGRANIFYLPDASSNYRKLFIKWQGGWKFKAREINDEVGNSAGSRVFSRY